MVPGSLQSAAPLPSAAATSRDLDAAQAIYARLVANLEQVLRGQRNTIRHVLAAFAASGHVLLEDVPGTGKTTLAKALARSIEAAFQRIQFTPDLLPADILGASVYEGRERGEFRFHPGPIFTDILLADEINRASPRTQSALLEAMGEGQVSLDGVRRPLGDVFFVVATQNPDEFEGTYPLPESQMDRFTMRLSLGYVDAHEEVAILSDRARQDPLEAVVPCAGPRDVGVLRDAARSIRVAEEIKHYIVALVAGTRIREGVRIGASPRASLSVLKVAQAIALFDGLDYVAPEHVQEIAAAVIAHRVVLEPEARYGGLDERQIAAAVLAEIAAPG